MTRSTQLANFARVLPGAFGPRSELVAWVAANPAPPVGTVVTAGGLQYKYSGSGGLPELPGWVPMGRAYLNHFTNNAAPGVTDVGPAIVQWLQYGGELGLLDEEYLWQSSVVEASNILSPVNVVGKIGAKIIFRSMTSDYKHFMKITAPAKFSQVNFTMECPSGGSAAFWMINGSDILFKDVTFNGGVTGPDIETPSHLAYVMNTPSGFGPFRRVRFLRCKFNQITRSWLTANVSTVAIHSVHYRGCNFDVCYGPAVSPNGPNADIRDVQVVNCEFDGAIPLTTISAMHYVGFASVRGFVVHGNTLRGTLANPIHIEEDCQDFAVTNNVILCDVSGTGAPKGAITLQDNNISGTPELPLRFLISGNVIIKQGTQKEADSRGIWLVSDATAARSAQDGRIQNNLVVGMDIGYAIAAREQDNVMLHSNTAQECAVGFEVQERGTNYEDNKSDRCDVGVKGTRAMFLRHRFADCPTLIQTTSGAIDCIDPTVTKVFPSVAASSTSEMVLLPEATTSRMFGRVSLHCSTSTAAESGLRVVDVSFNGTDFTTATAFQDVPGAASPSMSLSGGNVRATVFSGSARTDVVLAASFSGVLRRKFS